MRGSHEHSAWSYPSPVSHLRCEPPSPTRGEGKRRALALFPREVKILTSRRRAVGKGLLAVPGRGPDVVADDVEQLSHLDMRLLDVMGERDRERAVAALAVQRGLAMLGG